VRGYFDRPHELPAVDAGCPGSLFDEGVRSAVARHRAVEVIEQHAERQQHRGELRELASVVEADTGAPRHDVRVECDPVEHQDTSLSAGR
jgi:hypothetical protein